MLTTYTMPETWASVEEGAEISHELYWRMLPPISLRKSPYFGFQVSEPVENRLDSEGQMQPVYLTFITVSSRYFYAGLNFARECKWRFSV